MIFRRRPKATDRAEARRQYRKQPGATGALTLQVTTPTGVAPAQLLDLSVQGVGAAFVVQHDPGFALGAFVELVIQSLGHGEVRTPARVVYSKRDRPGTVRYGFEFVSVGDLYAQLDAFHTRLFNRRRSRRVRPPLDCAIDFQLAWGDQSLRAPVHELSASGVGLVLPVHVAARLDGVVELEVGFRLPGVRKELCGRARIRNRARSAGKAFLGLEFDLREGSGLARHEADLRAYVERRSAEIRRWQAAWQ